MEFQQEYLEQCISTVDHGRKLQENAFAYHLLGVEWAVIGGLIASTVATLFILPLVFAWVQAKTSTESVSLDPEDKNSRHYISSLYEKL